MCLYSKHKRISGVSFFFAVEHQNSTDPKYRVYGRVCTTVCEVSGNFTCGFKNVITAPKSENLKPPKWSVSFMGMWHAEPDMKEAN